MKDLATKRRQYRYEIKSGLNLKQGDTKKDGNPVNEAAGEAIVSGKYVI
jgi:hypothetical protein